MKKLCVNDGICESVSKRGSVGDENIYEMCCVIKWCAKKCVYLKRGIEGL